MLKFRVSVLAVLIALIAAFFIYTPAMADPGDPPDIVDKPPKPVSWDPSS